MPTTASSPSTRAPLASPSRVDWVDYAKGLCIILVVMFHTVNHYQEAVGAAGWMGHIVDFSKPFRMPDFFLISGLFLSRTINGSLRDYIDKKVIHFAYFYLLWLAITLLVTDGATLLSNPMEWAGMFGWNILQPVGSLWFVHMLAVFYVITRAVRRLPKWAVLAAAAALQIAHQALWIDTPSFALNRLMDYFVFFFIGYALSGLVFDLADRVKRRRLQTLGVILAWALANAVLAGRGYHFAPVYGLLMGVAGAIAVIETAVLLSQLKWTGFLRYCGQNSIVIYLTFYFPMTALIRLLSGKDIIPDVGWACAAILAICVLAPLGFHRLIKATPLSFFYKRPGWAKLKDAAPKGVVAAA
jgi:uncharacterized membrane protein YcfT